MNLAQEFDRCFAQVREKATQVPWQRQEAYACWLAQTYYFVQHTTRLLALAASKFGPLQQEAHLRTLKHLREEGGHDMLALKDLRALGYELPDVPELLPTALFYQTQYYWIEHGGPVALQGYALLLEGLAVREAAAIAHAVDRHHGPGKTSFLKVHAEDDISHFANGLAELDKAPSEVTALVLRSLEQSAFLYTAILQAVIARVTPQEQRRAA